MGMTAGEVAMRLCASAHGITAKRIATAKDEALRAGIDWDRVLSFMDPEERARVAALTQDEGTVGASSIPDDEKGE